MSVRDDFSWTLGETWTYVVTCTDADGNAVNPVSADFKIKSLFGDTLFALTNGSGISVATNVCTITIPTTDQTGIDSQVVRHRLKITDSGGAISRQVHGYITVLPDDDN
jgi:hypothetical protein